MEHFVVIVKRLEAVNYYHKVLHLGCCSNPRSASAYRAKILSYELNSSRTYSLQYISYLFKLIANICLYTTQAHLKFVYVTNFLGNMTYEFELPRIIIFGFLLLFCSPLLNGDVVVRF